MIVFATQSKGIAETKTKKEKKENKEKVRSHPTSIEYCILHIYIFVINGLSGGKQFFFFHKIICD